MKGVLLSFALLLHCMEHNLTQGQSQVCQPQPTCAECLRSPGCAWCMKRGFLTQSESDERRCDTPESLRSRNCSENDKDIINPNPNIYIKKNDDLSSKLGKVFQLKPQNLHVKLRVGKPETFKFEFQRADGYPIDLYYLMDLSYSMKDDLVKIKSLGQKILNMLKRHTNTVRIGFGSFVDKETLPYVSQVRAKRLNPCPSPLDTCQPAFTFQNVLPLTNNAKEFEKKVSMQRISGNLDSPEAGFDAIMQAAVCHNEIRWGNVTRVLVYTSDGTFHIAGDGRLSGIFQPHDGHCHLDESGAYQGLAFDYPSVGHLSRILQMNNIQLIFAVTEDSFPDYQALSALIPQSVVGLLKNDSSNVVQLISDAYSNLSSTIMLEHEPVPGLDVSYKASCTGADGSWQKRGQCHHIKADQKVEFTVRLNASTCLEKPQAFSIRVQGISEMVQVSVETLCDCNCGDWEEKAEHCNSRGMLTCGLCSCDEGYLGQHCECKLNNTDSIRDMLASCHHANSAQVCSGHGNCECGSCKCRGRYHGMYCECDDLSCERRDNALCSGHGNCVCGKCLCSHGYSGSACECSSLTDQCMTEKGTLCSRVGRCQCNKCQCPHGFAEARCSAFINPCLSLKNFADCIKDAGSSGAHNCSSPYDSIQVRTALLEDTHQLQCHNDHFNYGIRFDSKDNILFEYAEFPKSLDQTTVIIGSSLTGILLIGIAIIIVYRLLLELYHRREYSNFVKAQELTDWKEMQNPLFVEANTTVVNPMHLQDG